MGSPTHIPRMAVSALFWKGLGIAAVLSVPLWAGLVWLMRLALQ